MPLTYTRQLLSGSTNGRPIGIDSTSSPGTTIHTVGATATNAREEVVVYIANGAAVDRTCTIEFGGTATTDQIVDTIPANGGLVLEIPGISLTATSSIVRAFGTATGALRAAGWVNRAT